MKNLHRTIVLEKPGIYDYKGTMHIWKGGGLCNVFGASATAIEIHSDGVIIKNFGVKGVPVGITIIAPENGGSRANVRLENLEIRSCYLPVLWPGKSTGLVVKDSILE